LDTHYRANSFWMFAVLCEPACVQDNQGRSDSSVSIRFSSIAEDGIEAMLRRVKLSAMDDRGAVRTMTCANCTAKSLVWKYADVCIQIQIVPHKNFKSKSIYYSLSIVYVLQLASAVTCNANTSAETPWQRLPPSTQTTSHAGSSHPKFVLALALLPIGWYARRVHVVVQPPVATPVPDSR